MKLLLIDNYDSFIYNLKYELELAGNEVTVCRNDINYQTLLDFSQTAEAIVLSPGPGSPKDAGYCLTLVKELAPVKPMLGVCLGHQVIVEAFGGKVGAAKSIVHGKAHQLHSHETGLMEGLGERVTVARYHSLAATRLGKELRVDAVTEDNEVMAVSHLEHPIFGLQFHPESIMTKNGSKILKNFVNAALTKATVQGGERYAELA